MDCVVYGDTSVMMVGYGSFVCVVRITIRLWHGFGRQGEDLLGGQVSEYTGGELACM